MNAEIKLTEDEVKDIIKQHLSEKYSNLGIGEVKIKLNKVMKGNQRDSYYEWYVEEITVEVEI